MKTRMKLGVAALSAVLAAGFSATAQEVAVVGKAAPDFELRDTQGQVHKLAEHKGKIVVLEWTNPDCPFVKKHYDSGNMQKLQADAAAKGTVWLTINSSAAGKQGYYPAEKWTELIAAKKIASAAVLLDPDGKVGKLYGAKTTPHVFVINAEGVLVYAGAIDNKATTDVADVPGAVNYVRGALDSLAAGKPVEPAETKSYGCGVKY
jgi:peroxiredoxin